MVNSIAIAMAAGSATYVWLTLSGTPIASAVRNTGRSLHGRGWPAAWPTAIGSAMLVTAIPFAALMLATLAAPKLLWPVLQGPELLIGLKIGAVLWVARAMVLGLPRIAPQHELSIALAAAALWNPDPVWRETLERRYRRYMLDTARTHELPRDMRLA